MDHAAATWASLQAIRERAPLIHNITNLVAMEMVANCLLALGASPAMVHAEDEIEDFLSIAQALTINIGTLSPSWLPSMTKAAACAVSLGKPWVLDPVGAGATPYRTDTARKLLAQRPTVLRGNASEILSLVDAAGERTKGVDSSHPVEAATAAAAKLSRSHGSVVAITGAVDQITDGERWLQVENGDARMTRVTALGCALSGVIGAFLVVEPDPLAASAQALAVFGLAGERAAAQAAGPGSFAWQFIDQLALLDEPTVRAGVRIA